MRDWTLVVSLRKELYLHNFWKMFLCSCRLSSTTILHRVQCCDTQQFTFFISLIRKYEVTVGCFPFPFIIRTTKTMESQPWSCCGTVWHCPLRKWDNKRNTYCQRKLKVKREQCQVKPIKWKLSLSNIKLSLWLFCWTWQTENHRLCNCRHRRYH